MIHIKKIFILYIIAIVFSIAYVTPIMGMMKLNNIETDTYEDLFLYAGVEEVFDIDSDKKNSKDQIVEDTTIHLGWTTTSVNVRKEPNIKSEIVDILEFNEEVEFQLYNNDWVIIQHNNKPGYICRKYITQDGNIPEVHFIPSNNGFKSYMSYKAITNKSSKQYKLQQRAYTGNYGIRIVKDRYCVVLGSFFHKEIGTYFDLVLENGTIIKCILSDVKSSAHTIEDNITSLNGCVSEFIVDSEHLDKAAKTSGDISSCNDKWNSPVVKINFY